MEYLPILIVSAVYHYDDRFQSLAPGPVLRADCERRVICGKRITPGSNVRDAVNAPKRTDDTFNKI